MVNFLSATALLLIVIGTRPALAQEAPPSERSSPSQEKKEQTSPEAVANSASSIVPSQQEAQPVEQKKLGGAGSIVVAPLPISSPAVGSGIVPVFAYIFPLSAKDKISPPSVVGASWFVTDNGNRGFAVGAQLYMKQDKYRLTSGFARGNVSYNIYGDGGAAGLKLPLEQNGQAFYAAFLRNIGWKFFAGPRFFTARSLISVRPGGNANFPIPPDIGVHTALTAIGAELSRDTSPNRFYPTSGTRFAFSADFFSQALGSKYSFQSYQTSMRV